MDQSLFPVHAGELSEDQLVVYEQLERQGIQLKEGKKVTVKITLVQGGAGTGKSFLLKNMFNYICTVFGTKCVKILAPTGVAARNVNGETIHSF